MLTSTPIQKECFDITHHIPAHKIMALFVHMLSMLWCFRYANDTCECKVGISIYNRSVLPGFFLILIKPCDEAAKKH